MDVSEQDKQKIRDKIKKLKNSSFKQQTLKAWRPTPTALSTTITFSIFSVIFLVIGCVLQIQSDKIYENRIRYDLKCQSKLQPQYNGLPDGTKCDLAIAEIKKDVEGPVYVYYGLENYYQNHRTYFLSRDPEQQKGMYKEFTDLGDCNPVIKVKDLWPHQQKSISGLDLDPDAPAIPCGLIAKSIFNDTFELLDSDKNPIFID